MLTVKTNDLGELYVPTPRRPYEITLKRQMASECRSRAATYRKWARLWPSESGRYLRWADEEDRAAIHHDDIARAWQKEIV